MEHEDNRVNDRSAHERRDYVLDRPEHVLAFLDLAETYWEARNSETQRERSERLGP